MESRLQRMNFWHEWANHQLYIERQEQGLVSYSGNILINPRARLTCVYFFSVELCFLETLMMADRDSERKRPASPAVVPRFERFQELQCNLYGFRDGARPDAFFVISNLPRLCAAFCPCMFPASTFYTVYEHCVDYLSSAPIHLIELSDPCTPYALLSSTFRLTMQQQKVQLFISCSDVAKVKANYVSAVAGAVRARKEEEPNSEPLAGRTTAGSPRGHWSFSWVAEDDLSFPNNSVSMSDHQCPGDSGTCDQQVDGFPEFTWSIVAAGDLREERNEKTEKKTGSPQGWEEGKNEGEPVLTSRRFSLSREWIIDP
ncbi:hypothetical protein F2P81_004007 [Scophthalmus maximus]|uniref:Uncharacterized protein n=1 Tax=Scophthalmus maximus TaxID=52904 RepID=A0A6A4TJ14_SCOMX|nr:hypothetical protein F2P81_004007 [Scophthalmus maximus]